MTVWALPDDVLAALDQHLADLQPTLTVEAGSGRSTAVLARHARRHIALEHLPKIAVATRSQARHASLDLRVVDLVPYKTPAGTFRWYDTELPDQIEFALIDGPPGRRVGREAAGFAIVPQLAADGEIWLDDADRDHEQHCLDLWTAHLPIVVTAHPTFDRIVTIRRTS
jgi:hypothetical protein